LKKFNNPQLLLLGYVYNMLSFIGVIFWFTRNMINQKERKKTRHTEKYEIKKRISFFKNKKIK